MIFCGLRVSGLFGGALRSQLSVSQKALQKDLNDLFLSIMDTCTGLRQEGHRGGQRTPKKFGAIFWDSSNLSTSLGAIQMGFWGRVIPSLDTKSLLEEGIFYTSHK